MPLERLFVSTAVDDLIKLVHEKGKISIDAAAKEIGISASAIEEWAKVLEEEKILDVEYKLAKPILVWRYATREEVEEKKIEFGEKKKEFEIEAESLLELIRSKGKDIDQIQKQFSGLSGQLGSKLKDSQNALTELKKLESEKNLLEDNLEKQDEELDKKIDETVNRLDVSQQKAVQTRKFIESELKESIRAEAKVMKLQEASEKLRKEYEELEDQMEEYSKDAKDATRDLKDAKITFQNAMKEYERDLHDLVKLREVKLIQQEKIRRNEEEINKHTERVRKEISTKLAQGKEISESFNNIVKQKEEIEKILKDLVTQKLTLEKKLIALTKRAEMIRLKVNSAKDVKDAEKIIKEMESELADVEKKTQHFVKMRGSLRDKVRALWQ